MIENAKKTVAPSGRGAHEDKDEGEDKLKEKRDGGRGNLMEGGWGGYKIERVKLGKGKKWKREKEKGKRIAGKKWIRSCMEIRVDIMEIEWRWMHQY